MAILATNKRANHEYEIIKKYEAGLVLEGHEVKSIKHGGAHLLGAFMSTNPAESLTMNGLKIARYAKAGGSSGSMATRSQHKLLLSKKEALEIRQYLSQKGLTIIPISLYTKHGLIKVELGVARGKKKWDKRDAIKKKDLARRLRTLHGDAI